MLLAPTNSHPAARSDSRFVNGTFSSIEPGADFEIPGLLPMMEESEQGARVYDRVGAPHPQ